MKTATERYNLVKEGKLDQGEFVRQMRLEQPSFITQFNGYEDTVQILLNKGVIFESKKQEEVDNFQPSLESQDRGIRYELLAKGIDPTGDVTEEEYEDAKKKAFANIKKDYLYYFKNIAPEKIEIPEPNNPVEVKRGSQTIDTKNQMEKMTLKEAKLTVLREDVYNIYTAIKDKYKDRVDNDEILAFVKMHRNDVAGKSAEDIVDEFENFRSVNEKAAKPDYLDLDKDGDKKESMKKAAKDKKSINEGPGAMTFVKQAIDELMFDDPDLETEKDAAEELIIAIADEYGFDFAGHEKDVFDGGEDKLEEGQDFGADGYDIIELIKQRALNNDSSEIDEAMEVMEFIGQEYKIDFEFGAGKNRAFEGNTPQEEMLKEGMKKVIKSILGEGKEEVNELDSHTEERMDGLANREKLDAAIQAIAALHQDYFDEGDVFDTYDLFEFLQRQYQIAHKDAGLHALKETGVVVKEEEKEGKKADKKADKKKK